MLSITQRSLTVSVPRFAGLRQKKKTPVTINLPMLPEDPKPRIFCYTERKRYVVVVFSRADNNQTRHIRYGAAIYRSDLPSGDLPEGFYTRPEYRMIRETMRTEALNRYRKAPQLGVIDMRDFKAKPPVLAESALFNVVQTLLQVAESASPRYRPTLNRMIHQAQLLMHQHDQEKKPFAVWYRRAIRKLLFRKHGCFGARLDKSSHLNLLQPRPPARPQISSVQEKDPHEESKHEHDNINSGSQ